MLSGLKDAPFAALLALAALSAGCEDPPTPDAGRMDAGSPAPRDAAPRPYDASFMRLTGDVSHPLDDVLRLNHLQAEATHNSYHLRPSDEPLADWDYAYAPLETQLDEQGVRAVELDLHWDPAGPGLRVHHITNLDEETTCEWFLDCLGAIRAWSDAHPGHHPIAIQLELKATGDLDFVEVSEVIDAEIRRVFPDELLVLPDDVQGARATLADAIAMDGWPTLAESRGRALFVFDCDRALCLAYANEGAGLTGRVVFVDSEPGDAFLAFRVLNSPGPAVRAAVEAGQLVRTRAVSVPDALTADRDALEGQLNAALDSGAHFISTDVPTPRPDVPFHVEIPGGSPSRCNPVSAPAECTAAAIEDPARLTP